MKASVNQTNIETISKATLGKLMRYGVERTGLCRAHRYHLELTRTEFEGVVGDLPVSRSSAVLYV